VTRRRLIETAALSGLVVAVIAALAVPPERTQGDLARLLFVHVPSIWVAYLGFFVTLVASALYLTRRDIKWDHLAGSAAEVGVFFTGATIAIGMIWAKPTWGVWWTWDARLVLTAVLFFVYLGYLALRRSFTEPETRARRAAWFGVLAIVQIPVVHFSVVWWRTLHQQSSLIRPGPLQMDAPFRGALAAATVAFTFAFVALVWRRIQLAQLEDEADALLASADVAVAGAGIDSPRIEKVTRSV